MTPKSFEEDFNLPLVENWRSTERKDLSFRKKNLKRILAGKQKGDTGKLELRIANGIGMIQGLSAVILAYKRHARIELSMQDRLDEEDLLARSSEDFDSLEVESSKD